MENLDLSDPSVLLFCGKPKRGKTSNLRYTVLKHSLDKFKGSANFEFGICFSRTGWNGDYDFMPSDYVYTGGYDEEVLRKYVRKFGYDAATQEGLESAAFR